MNKKFILKIVAVILSFILIFPRMEINILGSIKLVSSNSVNLQDFSNYVVYTKKDDKKKEIKKKYKIYHNKYTENLEKNDINIFEMTEDEAEELKQDKEITVEKDVKFKASNVTINTNEILEPNFSTYMYQLAWGTQPADNLQKAKLIAMGCYIE